MNSLFLLPIFELMKLRYSFIIPVFNRPEEVANLLESLSLLAGDLVFEVVIIEDGSSNSCEFVCDRFRESVTVHYHFKKNTGPGDSRNYGMTVANGNYFIILDSDCMVPANYLQEVNDALEKDFVDCYGGPDAAHERFSNLQKAVNYSMTSLWTTGGLRGGSEQLDRFQPRSFNMGLSKTAFEKTGGFGDIHPGEDPDLVMRLWQYGYRTKLITKAFVYHERRISWKLFYKQVHKFGMVRVILNKWHPSSKRLTYWFPTLFLIGLVGSLIAFSFGYNVPIILYGMYALIIFVDSTIKNNLQIGLYSVLAMLIQFSGYGYGFLKSYYYLHFKKRDERSVFPQLFFKTNS